MIYEIEEKCGKVKIYIEVLRIDYYENLAKEYLSETCERCPIFEVGQKFILEKFEKPENFCTWAWQDLFYMIHTLWNGGTFKPWYKENVVIAVCTDGIRPVTFKIERVEDIC